MCERDRLGPLERDQFAERRFAHVVVDIASERLEFVDRRQRAGGVRGIHAHLPDRMRHVARQQLARLRRRRLRERDDGVRRRMPPARAPVRSPRPAPAACRSAAAVPGSRSRADRWPAARRGDCCHAPRQSPARTRCSGARGPTPAGPRSAPGHSRRRALSE